MNVDGVTRIMDENLCKLWLKVAFKAAYLRNWGEWGRCLEARPLDTSVPLKLSLNSPSDASLLSETSALSFCWDVELRLDWPLGSNWTLSFLIHAFFSLLLRSTRGFDPYSRLPFSPHLSWVPHPTQCILRPCGARCQRSRVHVVCHLWIPYHTGSRQSRHWISDQRDMDGKEVWLVFVKRTPLLHCS